MAVPEVKASETSGTISSYQVDTDVSVIRSCIERIAKINKKQVKKAFDETQRNRNMGSVGSMNTTLGQAYFNLKSEAPRLQTGNDRRGSLFSSGFNTRGDMGLTNTADTNKSTRYRKHQGSFFAPKDGRSPKLIPAHATQDASLFA